MKKVFAAILVLALLFTLTASFADTWICEKCGRESERNFCSWCGAPKPKEPVICPNCGEKFDPDAGYAFCNNCGAVLRDEKQIIKPEEGTRGTCDGFDYIVLEDGTVEITGYSGTDSELVIPGELDGLTVTGIGKNAFNSCTTLFSAVIPDGVTYIDDYAFYGCRGLTEISIPDSVSTIGINPFDWCDRLTEFKLSPDHPFLEVTDGVLFGKADRKLICYPASLKSESYSVPDGTLLLGDEAFYNNRYLKTVMIPDSVKDAGDNPFANCKSLSDIIVSSNNRYLATIGGVLFSIREKKMISYPLNLKAESYTIPDGVMAIGKGAFYYCESLTGIIIPDSVTWIDDYAFKGCSALQSITIPDSVNYLGQQVFNHCESLVSVMIPNGVDTIGRYSFNNCSALVSVTIPDSVTFIGDNAFSRCSNLTEIRLPNNLTAIGDDAFYGCAQLTEIVLPDTLSEIGINPFDWCAQVEKITVSENHPYLEVIGNALYSKEDKRLVCLMISSSEQKLTIQDGTQIIGDRAMIGCSALTEVVIPESVTVIGEGAFAWCESIPGIVLPDGLAEIGESAFYGCENLAAINIPASVTSIGRDAFRSCDKLKVMVVPGSCAEDYCNTYHLNFEYEQ